jgi:predicted nucleotidyltransferase
MSEYERAITQFLADLDQAQLGNYSAVLHGSAARGDWVAGRSDINVVLVLESIDTDLLERLQTPLRRWEAAGGALPLLLTRAEWNRAADAYPLEIAEMRTSYKVLRGPDPIAGLTIRPADLRLALERDWRGKLLRLRQGYALLHEDSAQLAEFVRRSVPAILFLARGTLVLDGMTPPRDAVELAQALGRLAGFDAGPFARIVTRRGDPAWTCTEDEMRGYLAAVEAAARHVDHYQIGDRG